RAGALRPHVVTPRGGLFATSPPAADLRSRRSLCSLEGCPRADFAGLVVVRARPGLASCAQHALQFTQSGQGKSAWLATSRSTLTCVDSPPDRLRTITLARGSPVKRVNRSVPYKFASASGNTPPGR